MKTKTPAASSVARMKRHYRKICETHPDPMVSRMAQAMETSLRWATEETKGWPMKSEPVSMAECLLNDLTKK